MCIDFCVFLVKSIMKKYLLISLAAGVVLFLVLSLWIEFIPIALDLPFILLLVLMNPLLVVLPLLNIGLDSGFDRFVCFVVNFGLWGALIGFLKDRGRLDLRTKLFMAFIFLFSLYWMIGGALGRSA